MNRQEAESGPHQLAANDLLFSLNEVRSKNSSLTAIEVQARIELGGIREWLESE